MDWKYITIVMVLAAIVAGGILAYQYWGVEEEKVDLSEEKMGEEIPINEYVYIEILQEISGSPVMIDYPPTFRFNETQGTLEDERKSFEISDNLSAVIGNVIEVREPGGGGGGGLIPVYNTPFSKNIPFLCKILYLGSEGTVELIYEDMKIILESKEEWENEFESEWMGRKVVCKTRIKNYGLQDKDKIKLKQED